MSASADFDVMLNEIGDFSPYQLGQWTLFCLVFFYSAASPVVYIFTAIPVPHRCLIEECGDQGETSPFNPSWLQNAVPFTSVGEPEKCLQFMSLNSTPAKCDFDDSTSVKCSDWVLKGPERSIQTEFDLMCSENEWKLSLVGAINSLGVLFSVPIIGFIADKYGRKLSLILTLVASAVLTLIKSAAPDYVFFIVFEFLEALFSGGIYGIAFVLALEFVSPKRRVILGDMVAAWAYSLGTIFVGVMAWALRDWREILWTINAPAVLFIFYIWLIPESIRWLLSQGRRGDAKEVFTNALRKNKSQISPESAEKLKLWENTGVPEGSEDKEETLWAAIKLVATSRILIIRLFICFYCWIVITFNYYGLALNSINLAGTDDQYVNYIVSAVVDMPANVLSWLGMSKIGRKKTLSISFIISGLACFFNPFIPEDATEIRLSLYLLGKLSIAASFGCIYMINAEIFPTKLRTSLLGLCSMVGRLGNILAPFTPLLTKYSKYLPLTIFGVMALVAGGLAFLLPETKGRPLPVTVKDAENLGKKK
ncbi:organic cation transporter protein-like [Neocloeon triangulifer]|uniref:organic cation transporter protein-like n=1 Tax=Neocloeon triangulifer TaxID=2078957 RepID=UPI00286FAD29|nr:organic cation transporter protein-like [Neocloeon triangulifer]